MHRITKNNPKTIYSNRADPLKGFDSFSCLTSGKWGGEGCRGRVGGQDKFCPGDDYSKA